MASEGPVLGPQPSQERRRWCLFRCRRPPTDEDIFGKKWVTLTDPAGTRCAPCFFLQGHMLSVSLPRNMPVIKRAEIG